MQRWQAAATARIGRGCVRSVGLPGPFGLSRCKHCISVASSAARRTLIPQGRRVHTCRRRGSVGGAGRAAEAGPLLRTVSPKGRGTASGIGAAGERDSCFVVVVRREGMGGARAFIGCGERGLGPGQGAAVSCRRTRWGGANAASSPQRQRQSRAACTSSSKEMTVRAGSERKGFVDSIPVCG